MFHIDGRVISRDYEPYIIAEMSANHNGSIERAKRTIEAAKQCGAHAVKLQTYTPDTMTIDCDKSEFIIKNGLWKGRKLYELYGEASTPYEWHAELFAFAKEVGLTLFSTPFDETAVELLEHLNAPAYKISSFEITDLPLIKLAASTGKPLLISTGMASLDEIYDAVEISRSNGCQSILLFHCISSYPAPIEESNLKKLEVLRQEFDVEVGLSDHTLGTTASIAAVALGASAIEKHFTLDKQDLGPDSEFSIEPNELISLVRDTKKSWLAIGHDATKVPNTQNQSMAFRRSIYFVKNINAGEKITKDDIRRIRPGYGIPPEFYDEVVGQTLLQDVERGDPVTWEVIKKI